MTQALTLPTMTPDQLELITSTIAKGATPDELKLFLYRCNSLGLDPLKPGQIYFIKYGNGPGTIVVGIEGFRARAAKTGKLAGIKRGALRGEKGALIGAYAEVYRSDWKECAREEVPLAEYNTGKGNWAKMPETMIKKVAEAAALRMAFPDDLGGVYEAAEMDQAESKGRVAIEPPGAQDGIQLDRPGMIYYGYFARKMPHEVDRDKLEIERDRLGALTGTEPQAAFVVIDEYLKLTEGMEIEPVADLRPTHCTLCQAALLASKYGGLYCPNYKDKVKGEHTSIK